MRERDEVHYSRRAAEERQSSQDASDSTAYSAHAKLARASERKAKPLKLRLWTD